MSEILSATASLEDVWLSQSSPPGRPLPALSPGTLTHPGQASSLPLPSHWKIFQKWGTDQGLPWWWLCTQRTVCPCPEFSDSFSNLYWVHMCFGHCAEHRRIKVDVGESRNPQGDAVLSPCILFFFLPSKMSAHHSISSSNSTCCEFFFT